MEKVKLHEIIAHCACAGYSAIREFHEIIGGDRELSWDQLPVPRKKNSITIALSILALGEPGLAALHTLWVQKRQAEGWSWGKTPNVSQKESPFIAEYSKLPFIYLAGDLVFSQRVKEVWQQFDAVKQLDAEDKALWAAICGPKSGSAMTTVIEKATLFANGGAQAPLPDSAPNGPPSRVSRG